MLQEHYYRLDPILKKALQNFVREHMPEHVQDEENQEKEFWVSFYNMPIIERMRDLKAGKLGRLVSFAGTVTRTSEVIVQHPLAHKPVFLGCPAYPDPS